MLPWKLVLSIRYKVLWVFIVVLLILTSYPVSYAFAETATQSASPSCNIINNPNGCPISSDNYKAEQNADFTLSNVAHGTLCQLVGMSPVGGCIGRKKDNSGKIVAYLYERIPDGGALGGLTQTLAMLYSYPPTSTKEYLANLGKDFGLVNPAYAAVKGSGANIIRPVEELWDMMKNITYLAFIIIFIAIGFMIMFRQKLNQQAVVSVQSALPSLVIGLILVTFSYLITALIIDLSFVSIKVVAYVFTQVKMNIFDPNTLAESSNLFEMFISSIRYGENVGELNKAINTTLESVGAGLPDGSSSQMNNIADVMGALVKGLVIDLVARLIGALISVVVPLILIVALFIQFFRLFFKLLMSYIMLLITTVIGPLLILVGTIPGKGGVISFWWKNLLGHSLVFPASFAVFLFAGMILADPGPWNASLPLFGGLSPATLKLLIAYGIILGLPAVPDMVKKLVGAQDIGEIGKEGMGGFMAGAGALGGATSGGYGLAMKKTGLATEKEGLAKYNVEEAAGRAKGGTMGEAKKRILGWLPTPK